MSKEYNNVTLTIYCISKTNNNEYKDDSLNRIMYIYRVFLTVKSFLKEVMLRKLYKSRENISCITNIENTVQKEKSSPLSVVTTVMSKSNIDVEILEERTVVVMSRS